MPAFWKPAFIRAINSSTAATVYTDCVSLAVGLQPNVSDAVEGITAPRPASPENHACDDVKEAAANPAKLPEHMEWGRTERYWNGYRLYSAPLASAVSILALKLTNLVLLALVSAAFFNQGSRLVGSGPMIGLSAPVLFCSDYVRIWHVTPHTVSTLVIIGGCGVVCTGRSPGGWNRGAGPVVCLVRLDLQFRGLSGQSAVDADAAGIFRDGDAGPADPNTKDRGLRCCASARGSEHMRSPGFPNGRLPIWSIPPSTSGRTY